jgi:hypothetical protein
MEKRVNCGYEIIAELPTGKNKSLVIGHNPRACANFVVWYCTKNVDKYSYDTGGYTATYAQALDVIAERIQMNRSFSDFGIM